MNKFFVQIQAEEQHWEGWSLGFVHADDVVANAAAGVVVVAAIGNVVVVQIRYQIGFNF